MRSCSATFMMPLGGSLVAAKVLNVLLLGVTAGSVFALARLLRCPWAGLATVLFLGFSQDHLHQWHTVQTENPGLAFAALAALALVQAMLRQSARGCLLAGLLSGLGNVAAGHVLMALPLVAVALALPLLRSRSHWRRQGLMLLAFVCGASAMLLPWMAIQKYRHGVLTITMNSSELLAGTADPKHGKLTAEILGEAEALGSGWRTCRPALLISLGVSNAMSRLIQRVLRGMCSRSVGSAWSIWRWRMRCCKPCWCSRCCWPVLPQPGAGARRSRCWQPSLCCSSWRIKSLSSRAGLSWRWASEWL